MITHPILLAVVFAEFQPGDFGDRIGFIGRLKRAGQQRILTDRLRIVLRVNTGTSQIQKTGDPILPRAVNKIQVDREILMQKLGGIRAVGVDPSHLRGGIDDAIRFLLLKKTIHFGGIAEIELTTGARDQGDRLRPSRTDHATDGRTNHSPVP
ncbi:MAG: hypothetical protein BWY82_02927 [Verrucomicrobia bacterium ADurb.Bin474]|nr:MAG: hypothetical protein BWY82_02927 [Verrucomicrobia bacterium ADurb.Bin474]